MSTFPGSPRLLKGGIVLVDPDSGAIERVIVLQYNPDTLTRTLQVQGVGAESGDRLEAMRLKGPPVETYKLEAEFDATDQLETPDQFPNIVSMGLEPQLAALETIIYPSTTQLQAANAIVDFGTIEIAPAEAPMALFVWSQKRIVPVRITDFSITEEAFDTSLNPIRAKVTLGLRVLSVNDLGFSHKGSSLFLTYQQQKERMAAMNAPGTLSALGIAGIS
jgi:hypothetical protein